MKFSSIPQPIEATKFGIAYWMFSVSEVVLDGVVSFAARAAAGMAEHVRVDRKSNRDLPARLTIFAPYRH